MNNNFINYYKIYKNINNLLINKNLTYSEFEEKINELYNDYLVNKKIYYSLENISIMNYNDNGFNDNFNTISKNFLYSDAYLSSNILNSIKSFNAQTKLIKYICKIENIEITINIFTYDRKQNLDAKTYINKILLYFKIIKSLTKSECMRDGCNIYLFLTKEKKNLNIEKNKVLSSINVNTGFCFGCKKIGNIIIYREEECMKVIAHELLHAFGVDKNLDYIDNKFIGEYYSLKSNIIKKLYLNEGLIEYLATIIYINIESNIYCKKYNKNIKKTVLSIYKLEFSYFIFQIVKILNYYNIKLRDLINKTNFNYDEDTHIFSYFFIKMILFYNKRYIEENNFYENLSNINPVNYKNLLKISIDKINNDNEILKLCSLFEYNINKQKNNLYRNLRYMIMDYS